MRQKRELGFMATLLVAFSSPSIAGDSDAETFGARRWPSAPRLVVNEEPRLCSRVLASATEAFLGLPDIGALITFEYSLVDMEPVSAAGETQGEAFLFRADLDLDGDGRRQVVIYRDNPFNWIGNWHYSYVFPSPEAFEAVKEIALESWRKPAAGQYPPVRELDLGAQQYFPSALTSKDEEIFTGDVWAAHSLFSFEGHYYFELGRTSFDQLSIHPITIYRLRASGRADPRCVIDASTSDRSAVAFGSLPSMGAFLTLVRTIGDPGPDSGTLHSGTWHNAQAESAVNQAATRPWTVAANFVSGYSEGEYFDFGPRMTRFLDDWSQMELWNRREYQTLLASMAPATESYASFLRSEFGMTAPAGSQGAKLVIENLLARRIKIPSQYEENSDSLSYFPQSALHRGVMNRNREEFEAGVKATKFQAADEDSSPPVNEQAEYSKVLLDAVEWPYGLDRLLELGADPNAVNWFGKSALMMAAHFDRLDAVRKLLRAGANVNLLTKEGDRFYPRLTRTHRTALIYAAENAGAEVIKALLDAGADKSSVDSQGNGMSFYLINNPRFTSEQRERGIEAIAAESNGASRASFDCARARSNAELAICTSPVLRIFDSQIGDAFVRLKQKGGSQVAIEQRAWLKERDGSCNAATDADCLAEVMRTRLRYLHKRLAE